MSSLRMKQPNVFNSIYSKLKNKDIVTIIEIKETLSNREFIDFKTYLKIFSKTLFRIYRKDLTEDNVRQIMVLRREFYKDEPTDNDEYIELIEYFESVEDYESCQIINKSKNEYNKN